MVKRKLKKLLALALSILLLSSNFTGLITPAQAAEATTQDAASTGYKDQFRHQDNGRPNLFVDFLGDNYSYRADGNPADTGRLEKLLPPAGYDKSAKSNPDGPENSWARYVSGDINSTTANKTIFWVGIGIDRKEVFKLLEGGQGLTSFEGGFYYDSNVVEPYYDPAYLPAGANAANPTDEEIRVAYKETISNANINNTSYPANTQWNSNYEILRAETGLTPTTDLITQEELGEPATLDDIMDEDGSWKMTYVSLELSDITTPASQRRLGGNVYTGPTTDADGNVVTPQSARGNGIGTDSIAPNDVNSDYQYLLLIPFRLKSYGGEDNLHLRLLRNATHFSIGAGTYGVDPYGAWERVTTRNPGKDLKLLTRFTGDLYLFGAGDKAEEVEYDALLKIVNGGSTENSAKLIVDGDPAVWPVWADTDGDHIYGLQSGIGMRLDVHAQIGYSATVTVTYESYIPGTTTTQVVSHDFTTTYTNDQDSYYTFVMPEFKPVGTVTVTVIFQHVEGDTFRIYLSDIPQPDDADYKTGNETTITTNLDATLLVTPDSGTINTFDPVVPHPNTSHAGITHADGPMGECKVDEYVRIHVDTHADYEAVVRIYSFLNQGYTMNFNGMTITAVGGAYQSNTDTTSPKYGEITLPQGGDITFQMAASDIDVVVTYQKATRYKATLEVYHDTAKNAPVKDTNVAQLAYLAYDEGNIPSTVYSGVVYENYDPDTDPITDDHRAVKDPTRKLPWVSRSAATLSGSLGGDTGRTGKVWSPTDPSINLDPDTGGDTIMALLASAPDRATFRTQINGLDLSTTVITKDSGGNATLTGFRKDLYGTLYSDADVNDFADILWELRERIEASPSLTTYYKGTVQRSPTDTTVVYTYYNLTPAQVQDYLLSIFEHEQKNNANQSGYRTVRRAYLTAKRLYDELEPQPAYNGILLEPIAPEIPRGVYVNSNYEREYEDPYYENLYLHSYNLYITAYQTYVDGAKQHGSPTHSSVQQVPSADINNVQNPLTTVTVPINAASAAKTRVEDMTKLNKWEKNIIKPDATPDAVEDPATPAHTIYTRDGRTVWVVLEADSAYTVAGVQLYHQNSDGSTGLPIPTTVTPAPAQANGYQNVYSFTMPEEDCVVRVTYTLRDTRKLNITVTGADGKADNVSVVEAYRVADPADTRPQLESRTNAGHLTTDPYTPDPIEKVFVGSTVTVTVKVDKDYNVELRAVNHNDATNIQIDGPADNRDGTYTFVIPNFTGDVDLEIAYTPKEQPKNWAEINAITPSDVEANSQNTAFWREGGLYHRLTDVAQGTALTGEITVAPGYYIYSVTAYGDSGNYPFTLTGNGYNGGYGTTLTGTSVPINVFVDMPGENLTVDVVFRKGIPEPPPANTLTLTVKDDDNEGPDFAPNWAKATVYDDPVPLTDTTTVPAFTLGEVGKNAAHGNGTLSDRDYAEAGQWVKVEFHNHVVKKGDGSIDPAQSYYVSKVSVGPQHLGVSMVWEDDHTVSFYMPAGSTGVTVEFSKYPENGRLPAYFLTVRETYTDLNATPAPISKTDYENNYVTYASSDTIASWNGGNAAITLYPYNMATGENNPERLPATTQAGATGVAVAGELVTMTFDVDEPNWYVQSVVVISDGAAYRGSFTDVTPAGATKKTYEAQFRMPTGDAEFIVHYRRGPRPDVPDYGLTLTLTDDDNELLDSGLYDENNIVASFHDASGGGVGVHTDLEVGHNKGTMTDVRHIHAGDTVTLKTTIADGYTLEYMIVNPTGLKIYPVWTDPNTATFTMPNQGVAVVARIIKGDPQRYTANLILHPPAGMTSMDGVGQGTFVLPAGGSLNNYPQSAIFSTYAVPGTTIPYDLYAFDGYYIDRVTINPDLGVTGSLSGAFGYQDGEFTMPAANVNVNVWFKKGWPDEATYRLTLEVFDAAYNAADGVNNNNASFFQITHTDGSPTPVLNASDKDPVYGGQRKLVRDAEGVAFDRDTVYVAVNKQAGSYVDSSSIQITDSAGNTISWWYAPGGIAFTMPPRSTTVRITFRQGTLPQREAQLHITGADGTDKAVLTAVGSADATPNSVDTDGAIITKLTAGETLHLNVTPDAARHVTAAYAVNRTTGEIIPLTMLDSDNVRVRADLVYAGGEGEFAMPEANVDVYVKFAAGEIKEGELPLKLMVSGVPDSGYARADVTAPGASMTKTDMTVSAPGMDTRFVQEEDKVVATFKPNVADDYAITKLEVYDTDGNPVPYEWISVLQDPPSLTDPDMWLGTAPGTVATHPSWKQNPDFQITFPMPDKGVTIHVTYDKVDKTKEYVAQVVVNDEDYSDQPTPSRNNAWLRNEIIDSVQRKIQTAHPGDWIDLDISVHPGYRIAYVKVVPQSFGIVPGLPLGVYESQNTGFVMPAGNVTVYVKFEDDGLEERNATLVVTGAPTGDAANYGVIASPRSGTSAPVLVGGAPQVVMARPTMDWITADYYWNTNGSAYVKKVSVTTTSGVAVPFTQLEDPTTGHGTITFPMVDENVTVRVEYSTEKPIGEEIYLHVIDATTGDETLIGVNASALMRYPSAGTADWNTGAVNPLRRDTTNPWGNTVGAYYAPAGQKVRVVTTANTAGGVYLQSAYVLYEDVGQMINLPNATTGLGREFVVHPGRNDVYVTFTRTEPDPDEHAAILMLKAPENNAGRASIAANDVYDGPNVTDQDRLNEANVGHARVVAKEGNRIIIQVAPAEGYVIDSVLVTPLGFPLKTQPVYNYTMVGNTISFDMPHRDIAITVTLKRGTNQFYDVKLHYIKDTDPVQIINYAQLAWTDEGTNNTLQADLQDSPADVWEDVQTTQIREGTNVTLTGHLGGAPADPDHPDTILSAFVLRNGTLVSLNPSLEGKATTDGTPTNHSAEFIMPAGDVDVYLVVTTDPPENPWHTAVLVVTDSSPNGNDIGENVGYLWKNNETANRKSTKTYGGAKGYTWIAVEEGDTFAVRPEANGGYAFVPPATLSCNDGTHGGNMYAESTSPYVYRDTMGTCNKAALITFVSDEALKLTVIIRDPENPSDGSVTNKLLTRQPTATPNPVPDLNLVSENVGGAYQIMEGVTAGEPILLTATPANDHFVATAQIHYYDGTVEDIPLTLQPDGTFTGSILMPRNNATIIVTFHGDYNGTLTLRDLSASDKTAQATMVEDSGTAPDRVTVNHLGTSDTLTYLYNGTTLTANMIKNDNLANKRVTALLHRNGYTTIMTPSGQNAEGVDEYTHTINRASAEIIMVVRDKTSKTYVAAVETVNKPDFADDPTIQADPVGAASGAIWTTADDGDTITTTFPVPDGYEAKVATNQNVLLTDADGVLLDGTSLTFPGDDADHTVTFDMPAADTQVTITYRKIDFELTLVVMNRSGVSDDTQVYVVDYANDPMTLTGTGDNAWVHAGDPVKIVEAVAGSLPARSISYSAANGASGFLSVGDSFPMPEADTVVTVIYDKEDPDNDRYIALVKTVHPAGDYNPGNKATNLANLTTTSGLADNSPYWVEGLKDDTIRVAYQIEPGYIAQVTAYKRGDPSTVYAVANVASASNGMATVTMPGGTDIVIQIEYIKVNETPDGDVILQLVAHGGQAGNSANVTSPIAGTLSPATIAMDGANTPGNGIDVINWNWANAIETPKVSTSTMGDELRVYAHWAANYQVVRMTVAVRRADNTETPEVPITVSRYGSAAAGRTLMPYVDKAAGEAAVVRVYYGNHYEATLHVVRNGTTGDETHATDNRGAATVTSTGSDPIYNTGDKLLDFAGDGTEHVWTTAIPDTLNGQRLVGVVWESRSTGAADADPNDPDTAATDPQALKVSRDGQYNFKMPADNVDFYAVYEKDDPDNRSYIAKVKFQGTEHLGSADNAVTITNTSDAAAAHGAYWTAAKKDETIVVNVKVAPGYKAKIITTYKDHETTHTPPYDFYINRVSFVPNLTLGKDATFTMPENTDATVTIEYIKGYDLTLEVADTSGLAAGELNTALVTTAESPARTLYGQSDGTDITYDHTTSTTPPVLEAVDGGVDIRTDVTAGNTTDGKTAQYKVYYSTPFSGTTRVDRPTGTPSTQPPSPYTYKMPSADTVETVLFYNEDTPLLAKVEVKGESDIHGNEATPIVDNNTPAPTTATGTVWTTTTHETTKDDAHIIDLTLSVANGYVAKIRVRRDNDNYYNNPNDETKWDWLDPADYVFQNVTKTSATATPVETDLTADSDGKVQIGYQAGYYAPSDFPDDISGEQHFRFIMAYDTTDPDKNGDIWAATDVTVIVEFVFAGDIPRPFDPDRMEMEKIDLERGFIYGENRGDFALIDIPTLYQDSNKELFDTDNYDKPTTGTKDIQRNVKYTFFLYDATKDEYTPLELGVDVLLEPEDEDTLRTAGDPYNYYDYKTKRANNDILDDNEAVNGESTYTGSRLKLIPTDPDKTTKKRTDGAQALYDMLNNNSSLARKADGTLATNGQGKYYTTLYVIAEDAIGQKSAYTQVWIRPHFTIEVGVISYAPNHATTASVYKLMTQDELDEASGYAADNTLTQVMQDARNFQHYRWDDTVKPYLSNYTAYDEPVLGANKYYQKVGVKSSELLGGYDPDTYDPGAKNLLSNVLPGTQAHYALTLEKASDLTYTRVDLDLWNDVDLTDPADPVLPSSYYDPEELTYKIADIVYLITGDVDGNGYTKWQDYDTVYTYVWRNIPWNNTVTEAPDPTAPNYATLKAAWLLSTYNPDSMAYRCDLNGDRVLSVLDVNIVQTVFDYNRSEKDYLWTRISDGKKVLPFGFGKRDANDYAFDLFALRGFDEPFPVELDEYWDSLIDPKTTYAPPLNTTYVDDDGTLWSDPSFWSYEEVPAKGDSDRKPANREEGAVMETPAGDEVMERPGDIPDLPVFDPGPVAGLPTFDPGLDVDLPDFDPEPTPDLSQNADNGPGEDTAETPADINTEE